MLTSKAWLRRFARKSSALGAMVVLTGSFLTVFGTAEAAHADVTTTCTTTDTSAVEVAIGTTGPAAAPKTIKYTCPNAATDAITNTSIDVTMTPSVGFVAAGGQFDLTLAIPALTLRTAVTAQTTMKVSNALTVSTNGTLADLGQKNGAVIPANSTAVPAVSTVKYVVKANPGATGTIQVKPGSLTLTVPTGGGTGGAENEVWYKCTGAAEEDVEMNVTLTMPTTAKANEETSIGWSATNAGTDSGQLKAPTGMTGAQKVFVELSLSGGGLAATASGEGSITAVTAGSPITLPSVPVKVKPTTTGTVTVKPGPLKIGTSATAATINCALDTAQTNLKSYTFTVAAGTGGGTTTTPTPTPTTPRPTTTKTVVVTETPKTPIGKVTKTPKAGAETGGGGEMGPDARNFVMAGTAMILAAGVGGLMMRRRRSVRG